MAVKPPGLEVAVYDVIALPPLEIGAVNTTFACPIPFTAVPIVGALGTVAGVTAGEATDARLEPTMFVALTVKV